MSGDDGPVATVGGDDAPVARNLGNGLVVVYVVDHGDHFSYVQHRHLKSAGVVEGALHERAIANLVAMLEEREARWQKTVDGVSAIFFDGIFEASLILVDFLWDEALAHLAPNGFVVAIPARDILAFSDAHSEAGIAELRRVIARVQGGDHLLKPVLYRRDASTHAWRVFDD